MAERPTFSPLWHRVRAMKPRLRPHCQITRQHYRGRRWHVVHDPTSNQFYRLSPIAHEMVSLLDGRRTVEDAWNSTLQLHGDSAPTQHEVIELLSQMYNTNLLAVDTTPETEQLLRRGRERVQRRVKQQAIGIMYFKVRVFNPDRYLAWLEPILRPLLNRWGLIAWAVLIAAAAWTVLPRWDELGRAFQDSIAPSNWLWIGVVFVVIKAIHETGHGVLCKRFGGQVPEFGLMLLVLFPAPYVDASACWAFPSKWRRMAVGAGGMIFELFVAGIAAFIWAGTGGADGGGQLINQLAFNAMFTASVATVLFNANPLMRFDGYYILSDLLEVPNLMQRSMRMLTHLSQVLIYRVKESRSPTTEPAEALILVVYGLGALAYRVFLFFVITLYIMGQLFAIGLVLAVWTAAAWFILPLGKFVHWLATSERLGEHRPRAIATTLGLLVAGVVLLGVIPVPDRRRADGVVQSTARAGVFFVSDGFVTIAHKTVGERVDQDEPIVTCENPRLRAGLAEIEAKLDEAVHLERQLSATSIAGAQVARERIETLKRLRETVASRVAGLVVRAPHAGVLVAGTDGVDPQSIVGAFVQRGRVLCEVIDPDAVRIAATLTTAQAAPLHELGPSGFKAQVRPLSGPSRAYVVAGPRLIPGAQSSIPHAALGFGGGGTVATDPQDPRGLAIRSPQFTLYLDDIRSKDENGAALEWTPRPGERVAIRFSLPSKPLAAQWFDRLLRLIQGRVDV
ncbi:MAG: PqqD family peptide modification chaperone [Phycisphaerales bacterium]